MNNSPHPEHTELHHRFKGVFPAVRDRLKTLFSTRRKAIFVVSILLASFIGVVTLKIATKTSIVKLPTLAEQKSGVEIYDRNDKLVTVVQKDGDRQPIPIGLMSPLIRQAVIGIEDQRFYHHTGVDPLGITRAIIKNVMAQDLVEGGSTITQQLMKTMFFGHDDRTAKRKFFEVFMALDVETCYSKDKILETYLNTVYFGRGAYGIQRASYAYFSKPAKNLNLEEAAFLAALIKAPSDLGNPAHLKRAVARQHEVLDGMADCKFITKERAQKAKAVKLSFKEGPHPRQHPYYVNHVVGMVRDELGEDRLFAKPIKIYTNIDVKAQKAAEQALARGVKKAPLGIDQGAVISIDLKTGGIIAMVGGVGQFKKSQWNRATNPHTAGSSFKPFVYLAALIDGTIGANSIVNDAPLAIPLTDGTAYTPDNFDGEFKGLMTVRDAIAQSRNVPAVQVAHDTGIKKVIETARKAGITSQMDEVPALALGTCAVSPLDMANSYATLARGGEWVEPLFIRHINEPDGKLIKEYKSKNERRLPLEPVLQLTDVMEDVVNVGTGQKAKLSGVPVAGKTGTADDSKDVWFVGFTPDVVTAVWAGNDANKALKARGITGGAIAAGIWSQYMTGYYKSHGKTIVAFADPEQPLSHSMPFYAYIPQAIDDTTEGIADTISNVDTVTQPVVEKLTGRKERHGGFFKKLAHGLRKLF